ncbi:MAG: ABC transporter ATP-binding protein [Acidimicrobiales bacterium]
MTPPELDETPGPAPVADPDTLATENGPWRLVLGLLRQHRLGLAGYAVVLGAATALPLVGSLLLARFVDLVVQRAAFGDLLPYAAGYALIGLGTAAVTIAVTWRTTSLAWRLTDGLRRDLTAHVLEADLAFHRDRTPGELVTRMDADVTAMTQFLSRVVARVIAIVLLGLAAVVVLAFIEPLLAPVLAVGLGLIGAVTWAQRNSAMTHTVAERTGEAEVMGVAEQYLAAAEEVAALGAGAHGVGRVGVGSARLVAAIGRRTKTQMRVQGSIRLCIVAAELLMVGVGALLMRRGSLGVAEVFLGFRFVVLVRQPVEGLTWRLQEAQGASGAARRVLDLLSEWRAVPGGTSLLPPGPLAISFEDIELIYDDEDGAAAALHGLSVVLPAGRTVGVVGRTGSGKTSLARLVLRLVAPTRGRLLIGGAELSTIAEADLRRRVAAIPQDVQLFPGTVADNVTLFQDYPDAEVHEALIAVGLGPWLAQQRDGLHAQLTDGEGGRGGELGAGLSAGQAQLLALARGLLRRPDVVVLDEATSRVDPGTQLAIAEATAGLVRGRTAIIIAHRLETLEICDDIAVMADGRLVEYGPRPQLAADHTSRYAQLLAAAGAAGGLA